jgi:hypothetical protein
MLSEVYLKRLGKDKDAFIENLKIQKRYNKRVIAHLNSCPTFEQFNQDAFIWKLTKQKHRYWKRISIKN